MTTAVAISPGSTTVSLDAGWLSGPAGSHACGSCSPCRKFVGRRLQRIVAEYNAAQAEGFRPGSAALVARMDRVAADMGVAADHGPAPMLSGTMLATARSSFDAVHPERGGVSTPEEVSPWWHEQRHSPAASRIREQWLTRDDDSNRW